MKDYGDVQIKVPDNLSDEEVATPGISITTLGQGLYKSLKLPLPTEPAVERYPILIHGGSTATGIFGIQFVKLSGLRVITTCSPRNSDYLRSLGVVIRALSDDLRREPRLGAIVPVDEEALCHEHPNVRGPPLTALGYEISERCAFSWGQVPAQARRVRVNEGILGDEPRAAGQGPDPQKLGNGRVGAGKLVYALW
ncbi:hypothetical protein DL770_002930 [Monosporascus sp. CRB-9-2]|nr:hypothetical protein DL770_002930 [Monosporascus sp. CRB-9-2]